MSVVRLDIAPGGEDLLPYAKKKLRDLKREMSHSDHAFRNKYVWVSSSETVYVQSQRTQDGTYIDLIRIRAGSGDFIVEPIITAIDSHTISFLTSRQRAVIPFTWTHGAFQPLLELESVHGDPQGKRSYKTYVTTAEDAARLVGKSLGDNVALDLLTGYTINYLFDITHDAGSILIAVATDDGTNEVKFFDTSAQGSGTTPMTQTGDSIVNERPMHFSVGRRAILVDCGREIPYASLPLSDLQPDRYVARFTVAAAEGGGFVASVDVEKLDPDVGVDESGGEPIFWDRQAASSIFGTSQCNFPVCHAMRGEDVVSITVTGGITSVTDDDDIAGAINVAGALNIVMPGVTVSQPVSSQRIDGAYGTKDWIKSWCVLYADPSIPFVAYEVIRGTQVKESASALRVAQVFEELWVATGTQHRRLYQRASDTVEQNVVIDGRWWDAIPSETEWSAYPPFVYNDLLAFDPILGGVYSTPSMFLNKGHNRLRANQAAGLSSPGITPQPDIEWPIGAFGTAYSFVAASNNDWLASATFFFQPVVDLMQQTPPDVNGFDIFSGRHNEANLRTEFLEFLATSIDPFNPSDAAALRAGDTDPYRIYMTPAFSMIRASYY